MGAREDTEDARQNWHWRNTMRPVRFFALDARASLPYFVLLVYFRPVTVFITVISTVVFLVMERQGLSFPASLRAFRCWFLGQRRPAWISLRRRRMVDYG